MLAALVTAQRDLALHLDTARTELISLPHQLADLQPMKTMPDSPPWSEPAWDMWWHEHCAALARYNEARINHMLLHALSFNGPIPAAVRNQITPLGPHLADMNTHITSLSTDLPGLASSFLESIDTCWPSAKSRLAAHAKRDAEVDSMRPFLSRVLSIDRSRTRIEASLATATDMNDHSEIDRCNREFREIDGQMAAAMRAIYQEFEGLTPGTSRVKEIRMDLRDAITSPIDPIKLINAIVKHVAPYVGDYPTIAADIKLMWADFDPQSGLFWNSDIERIDVATRSRYMLEAPDTCAFIYFCVTNLKRHRRWVKRFTLDILVEPRSRPRRPLFEPALHFLWAFDTENTLPCCPSQMLLDHINFYL